MGKRIDEGDLDFILPDMEDEIILLLAALSPAILEGMKAGAELATLRIIEAAEALAAEGVPLALEGITAVEGVISFAVDSPATRLAIATQENLIRGVLELDFANLRASLSEGIFNGESSDQIAQRVAQVLGTSEIRSQRIARTESIRALNQGDFLETTASEVVIGHEWSTLLDGRERASHGGIHGSRIAKGGLFPNGLRFPLDPSGDPSEVVNCRCVALDILKGEDIGEDA